jgi:gas vesicle protein
MSNQTDNQQSSGFTLGVILGAALGTMAVVLQQSEEGRQVAKTTVKKIKESTQDFKQTHPDATHQFEHMLNQALAEAQKATISLKNGLFSPKKSSPSASKRTFVRKGKSL